jgi:hypothetical protein
LKKASQCSDRIAAFALDRLALARGERAQKRVEIRIAVAGEMELLASADQETGFGEAAGILRGREGGVDGRGLRLLAQFAQRPDQRVARAFRSVGGDEKPASGHRRERDGHLKLGIIVAPGPLVGVGPGMVEHIFALAVALEVAGRGGDHAPARILDRKMRRRPAGAAADRARGFERVQEGMGEERVEPLALGLFKRAAGRIGAGVPSGSVNGCDGRDDARGEVGRHGRSGSSIWRCSPS